MHHLCSIVLPGFYSYYRPRTFRLLPKHITSLHTCISHPSQNSRDTCKTCFCFRLCYPFSNVTVMMPFCQINVLLRLHLFQFLMQFNSRWKCKALIIFTDLICLLYGTEKIISYKIQQLLDRASVFENIRQLFCFISHH